MAEGLRENLARSGLPVFGSRERDVGKSVLGTDTRKTAGGGQGGGHKWLIPPSVPTVRTQEDSGLRGLLQTSDGLFSENDDM